MYKVSKEDFNRYLGSAPFYSEKDKERFFHKRQNNGKRKRLWLPQLLTAAFTIGLFVIAFQFFQNHPFFPQMENRNADYIRIGEENWPIASSKGEVEEFFSYLTPGLSLAEEKGIVKEGNRTVPLTKEADFRIEKLWYTSDGLYIFYSIGVNDFEQLKKRDSIPAIEDLFLKKDSKNLFYSQHITLKPDDTETWDTIFYKNRIYQRMVAPPLLSDENIDRVDTFLVTDITVDVFGEKVTLEDVDIPIYYDYFEEKRAIASHYIDQSLSVDGFRLNFERLDIRVTDTLLYTTIESPSKTRIWQVEGRIDPEPGTERDIQTFHQFLFQGSQSWFTAELKPLQAVPDELTVHIDNVRIIGDDTLRFSVNRTDFAEVMETQSYGGKTLHKKIAEIKNTNVYMESLDYDERGIKVTIKYERKSPDQPMQLEGTELHLTTLAMEDNTGEDGILFPNVVSVENEKGEPFDLTNWGKESENEFYLLFEREFVEESNRIDVEIDNLVYALKVNQSISFPVSN